jgi:mitogen-activated protein kinase-activated protein kinase 5
VLEAQRLQKLSLLEGGGTPGTPYTYDKSVDMWSLGVILYIMLCGYPPFYSEDPVNSLTSHMRKKIMTGDYEFPPTEWDRISLEAKGIVKR